MPWVLSGDSRQLGGTRPWEKQGGKKLHSCLGGLGRKVHMEGWERYGTGCLCSRTPSRHFLFDLVYIGIHLRFLPSGGLCGKSQSGNPRQRSLVAVSCVSSRARPSSWVIVTPPEPV